MATVHILSSGVSQTFRGIYFLSKGKGEGSDSEDHVTKWDEGGYFIYLQTLGAAAGSWTGREPLLTLHC